MKGALPFVGMLVVQFAQVALMVVIKKATSTGMSSFSFTFYSNLLASLILLPSSLLIHRSNGPPVSFYVLSGFLSLGILGLLVQVFGYAGLQYASPSLFSAMLNLLPGFTFMLAIIFGMETVDFGSSSTQAKSVGTIVSIIGAIIVTLYKGPEILASSLHSLAPHNHLLTRPSNWIIGGVLAAIDTLLASMFLIGQALVLKKYPAELTVMFSYSFIVAILSALASLIIERDLSTFSLQPRMRLISVLYSGFFGATFQVTIGAWCVRRKGPLFVAMFHPIGIVISMAMAAFFLGEGFYLGSLLGAVVIVIGFYSVMWGKSKEKKNIESNTGSSTSSKLQSEKAPLLQDDVEEQNVLPLP